MNASAPIIGIVGGVGSGKSTVAGMLRDLGCVVADSDAYARQALHDPAIRDQIVRWWGREVLNETSGEIDRKRLAAIVFANADERRRLETLTHPWIERKRRAMFDAAPDTARALVIDAPLLLEAGLAGECDAVIFVDASAAARRQRVQASRAWTETQWQQREKAQLPLDEKRQRADHVVVNSGDLADLRAAVERVLKEIVDGWKKRSRA